MATLTVQAQVISNFALTHFQAATLFSQRCKEVESDNAGKQFDEFFQEIRIYCSSSIITASASLEALINELFMTRGALQDAIPDFDTFFWGNHEASGLERKSALDKYKKAINFLDKSPLSKDDKPYRRAESLIAFRNYLIHFKPLWDDERRNESLEDRLSGQFETSPFPDEGADFLTMKCMSSGCASWAVQTVTDFVSYFSERSQLDPKKLGKKLLRFR